MDKLSELEFNAVEKILRWSKLDNVCDITEDDDGQDIFHDFEEDTDVSLKTGLEWVADSVVDEDFDRLEPEEQTAFLELMKRYDIDVYQH